jgi:hypothetical protein
MALVSILLAVVAFVCTLLGFVTTPIPVIGLLFSFGAAAVALGGAMLGGKAISTAKRANLPTDAARIAVVLNVIAFVPALLVALTCGVCNALFSAGNVQTQRGIDFNFNPRSLPGFASDAGPNALPPPSRARDAGAAPGSQPPPEPGSQPAQQPGAPGSRPATQPNAPGALPPPPLPPGPGK